MGFLTELSNALSQRMRTPSIGSILLSFFVINWQPIWYLLFADRPVRQKFLFFEANTSLSTLLFYPLFIGAALAIISPWLRMAGVWWAQFPSRKIERIKVKSDHEGQIIRMTYDRIKTETSVEQLAAKENLQAKRDESKIKAERLLLEAKEVGGDKLKKDLEKDRWKNRLSETACSLLRETTRGDNQVQVQSMPGRTIIRAGRFSFDSLDGPEVFEKAEDAVSELEKNSLIESMDEKNTHYEITRLGYSVANLLGLDIPRLGTSCTDPNQNSWQVYEDDNGHWHWRCITTFGDFVSVSKGVYRNKSDCVADAKRNGMQCTPS